MSDNIESSPIHPSALLNAEEATDMIFMIGRNVNPEMIELVSGDIDIETGKTNTHTSPATRYETLLSSKIKLDYKRTGNRTFENNMRLIDSSLPEIVSEMLKLHLIEGVGSIAEMVKILSERNPLNFKNSDTVPYYEFKIKKMLAACALGMQPTIPWTDTADVGGKHTVIGQNGKVFCHDLCNRDDFESYLIDNTKLETITVPCHGFLKIYKNICNDYFMKLSMQIRFV